MQIVLKIRMFFVFILYLTNNINKSWTRLETNECKKEQNIVFSGNRSGH